MFPLPYKNLALGPGAFRLLLATIVYLHHASSVGVGTAAVYIFFALSGYWIDRLWFAKYRWAYMPYVTFAVSRAWRLLPVFVVCSVASLLVTYGIPSVKPTPPLSPTLLVSSFTIIGYSFMDFRPLVPAWSLDIELQFYIVAPLILLLMARHAIATFATFALIALVSRHIVAGDCLPSYLPFFLVGIGMSRFNFTVGPRTASLCSAIIVSMVLVLATLPADYQVLLGGATPGLVFLRFNGYLNLLLALLALPIAFWTVTVKSGKFDRALGELSYPVYLVHWLVLQALLRGFPTYPSLPHAQRAVVLLGVTILVGTLSFLLWSYIDRPLNAMRARFVERRLRIHDALANV